MLIATTFMLVAQVVAPPANDFDFMAAGAGACRCENRVIVYAWNVSRTTVLVIRASVDDAASGTWTFDLSDSNSEAKVLLDRYPATPSMWPYCTDLIMPDAHPSSMASVHGRLTLAISLDRSGTGPRGQRLRASAYLTGVRFLENDGHWRTMGDITVAASGAVECYG